MIIFYVVKSMSDMKRRFKLKLGGNEYTIIGNTTPKKMDAVSRLLNEQLAEISKQMPSLSTEKAAILLAINAMSDCLEKQEELDRLREEKGSK